MFKMGKTIKRKKRKKVSTALTKMFLKPLRRQCFTWTMVFVTASSCVSPI